MKDELNKTAALLRQKKELLLRERENLNQREAALKKIAQQNDKLKNLIMQLIEDAVKDPNQNQQEGITSSPAIKNKTPIIIEDAIFATVKRHYFSVNMSKYKISQGTQVSTV